VTTIKELDLNYAMPHIHLEHTDNIHIADIMDLFKSINDILVKLVNIKVENCKSRAIKFNNFYIEPNDNNKGFVHLQINILEGRTKEIKSKIGLESLKVLKSFITKNTVGCSIQCSMEIRELKRSNYFTTNSI